MSKEKFIRLCPICGCVPQVDVISNEIFMSCIVHIERGTPLVSLNSNMVERNENIFESHFGCEINGCVNDRCRDVYQELVRLWNDEVFRWEKEQREIVKILPVDEWSREQLEWYLRKDDWLVHDNESIEKLRESVRLYLKDGVPI